jgi:hypothetical protein
MGLIRNIGYLLAGILTVAVFTVGGFIVSILGVIVTNLLWVGGMVLLVAYCIKDYFESKSEKPRQGGS